MRTTINLISIILGIVIISSCDKTDFSPQITTSGGGQIAKAPVKTVEITVSDAITGNPIDGVLVNYLSDPDYGFYPYFGNSATTNLGGKATLTVSESGKLSWIKFTKLGYVTDSIHNPSGLSFNLGHGGFMKLHVKQINYPDSIRQITVYSPNDINGNPTMFAMKGKNKDTVIVTKMASQTTWLFWTTQIPAAAPTGTIFNIVIKNNDTTKVDLNY